MANSKEIQIIQNDRLFGLLKLKKINDKHNIHVKELNNLILEAKVSMSKEDIAWVEKLNIFL